MKRPALAPLRFLTAAGLFAGAIAAGGCADGTPVIGAPPPSEAEKAGYLRGPGITDVEMRAGAMVVSGRAAPGARIRLTLANGEAFGVTTDAEGRFEVVLPAIAGPISAQLSAETRGRVATAEGRLFIPPGDPHGAVILRPGYSAQVVGGEPLFLSTIDLDGGGGGAVTGQAEPNADVVVLIDGQRRGAARASITGFYEVRLQGLAPGSRTIRVDGGALDQERTVEVLGAPGDGGSVTRIDGGWRVDWEPPGGGRQTTYVFRQADDA